MLCLAAMACSTPPPSPDAVLPAASAASTGSAGSPDGREDALPRTFAEDEVDFPAHPLEPIEPVYPPDLWAMGVEGQVEARVVVLADGSTAGTRILSSSHEAFSVAVRDSLRDAPFHPAQRAGLHVPSWVTLRLLFRLE